VYMWLAFSILLLWSNVSFAIEVQTMKKPQKLCFADECVGLKTLRYLGDFCWTAPAGQGVATLRLGVTHMGGGRVAMNGVIENEGEAFIMTGTAAIVDGNWAFTLTAAGGEVGIPVATDPPLTVDAAGATLFSGSVEPETLNGTIFAADVIGVSHDSPALSSGVSYRGSVPLTRTSCE